MNLRRKGRHPGEERDVELGRALEKLDAPEYPPDFLATVWERVDAEGGPPRGAAEDDTVSARGAATGRGEGRARRPRSLWARRPVMVTTAVVATVAVVAVIVLVGVPGLLRLTGPEPVSAAEVIQKALRAVSSGQTLQADVTEKYAVALLPDRVAEYEVIHARVLRRSDGSFRITRTDPRSTAEHAGDRQPLARGPLPLDPWLWDYAYDATRGVLTSLWFELDQPQRFQAQVTRGYPLGPPDRWADFQTDIGAATLALRAGRVGTVRTTVHEGRPAWVVSMTGSLALRPEDETYAVTIDQRTCLPVRIRVMQAGLVLFDYVWTNIRLDEPLPDAMFTFTPPEGAKTESSDQGFRRVSLDAISSAVSYVPLLPAWLPRGYVRQWTTASPRSGDRTGAEPGVDVVALQYVRGFDTLTITTRMATDPAHAVSVDPVEPDIVWASRVAREVRLTSGAFAGVTARVVVAPRITIPHLYAVKDGVLLTIAGGASASQLVAIAESLRPAP